jgi:phosphomannomutase
MIKYFTYKASCDLEKQLFENVSDKTPDEIKKLNLINLTNKDKFSFILKREYLNDYDKTNNPQGLGLWDWFKNYEKEAKVSTAGIRGPQNILFPQDTRFPINLIGITLATVAKALVIKEKDYTNPTKLAAREVRYNSDLYLEAIARIQAAYGIKTLVPTGKQTIPIWLASFLVFKLGLVGGEYITSSHGISVKNATKDLNSQGGQYLPEESMEFVNKIREIFEETEKTGFYEIKFSASNDSLIDEKIMTEINDGVDLYVDYLQTGVARQFNLDLVRGLKNKIVIENVGGSAYRTLSRVLKKLTIEEKFDWLNTEEDPFFHSIGKYSTDPKGRKCFYDYSVDATVLSEKENGEKFFPVISSMNYQEKLADYPLNTVILITDPDHDRLTITQIESAENINNLESIGIDYVRLSDSRVLSVFSANQAFLMLMNFRSKQLKRMRLWLDHPRFMIKTTASSTSWDEWAHHNGVKVVNVPVGFKEIANIMKKVENQLQNTPNKEIVIQDIFENKINLGKNPRLIFAGEESGGMIMGPPKLIHSENNYTAIAMREKSATEAIFIASALIARLEETQESLSQYFLEVLEDNKIISRFDTRVDISYYNESEPDIEKLNESKKEGEQKRTQNDLFYLTLAISLKFEIITLYQAKEILNDTFKELDFSNLQSIKFVGDGTYMQFNNKFVEIRPSGTDAKTKAYAAGLNKKELEKYAKILGEYSGQRTDLYNKLIPQDFYESAKNNASDIYNDFANKDIN